MRAVWFMRVLVERMGLFHVLEWSCACNEPPLPLLATTSDTGEGDSSGFIVSVPMRRFAMSGASHGWLK